MTAINEQVGAGLPTGSNVEERMPIKLAFLGNGSLSSIFFRICGTAFILTAPALWVLPGSDITVDMLPMKLGVTLFFLLCGLILLMRNHVDAQPEVYFDPIRREMRVLQMNDRGRPVTILRRGYDTLGAAHINNNSLEMWDVDGSVLMRLHLPDAQARHALRMHFSGLLHVSS